MRVIPLVLALLLVAVPAASAQERDLYVSLGDSWAAGYRPNPQTGATGTTTRDGFTYQLRSLARSKGYRDLDLVNFGCSHVPGETTSSMLNRRKKCLTVGPGGVDYEGTTQMTAGERYLAENRRRVAFVTIMIGGNDVTKCARDPDPVRCVTTTATVIRRNVAKIAGRVRRAVGPNVPILGGTYLDVILGQWVSGQKADQDFAALSTIAFKGIINPALKAAYATAKARFVDVTTATGAYIPLEQTTTLPPYGTIPVAVARVCELSYFCQFRDIHLNRKGYGEVARAFLQSLPRARRTGRSRARRG
jgi:lysophospholipase L1-like esterase